MAEGAQTMELLRDLQERLNALQVRNEKAEQRNIELDNINQDLQRQIDQL
jgi:hypothetical protein